jgi:Fanconi-associated nuclease 1
MICKLFCEDYKGRRSGGPDLFIWKAEQQLCKFVEVKGPGDTFQENQKLWVDGLLRANAAVEVCKVIDVATDNSSTKGKNRKVKTPASESSSRKKKLAQLLDSDSEEENYDRMKGEQERELSVVKADSHSRPAKRRRLTKPEDVDNLLSLYQPTTPLSPSVSGMKGHC